MRQRNATTKIFNSLLYRSSFLRKPKIFLNIYLLIWRLLNKIQNKLGDLVRFLSLLRKPEHYMWWWRGIFLNIFFGIVASSMFIFIMNLNISKSKMKLILHIILFKRAAAAMPWVLRCQHVNLLLNKTWRLSWPFAWARWNEMIPQLAFSCES